MANRPAIHALSRFISEPTALNASHLVGIPSIYEALQYHTRRHENYPGNLIALCKWVHDRGQGVLNGLIVHSAPPIDPTARESDIGWRAVSGNSGRLGPCRDLISVNRQDVSTQNRRSDIVQCTRIWQLRNALKFLVDVALNALNSILNTDSSASQGASCACGARIPFHTGFTASPKPRDEMTSFQQSSLVGRRPLALSYTISLALSVPTV
jgi:hypothetical protein